MDTEHGRSTDSSSSAGGRRADVRTPLRKPSNRRLVWICAIAAFSLLTGQSLLAPVAVGWRRAERKLAAEDELRDLQREHRRLQEEIEYRRTPAGQALTAAEVLAMTYPHGRLLDVVPRADTSETVAPPTLGERVKGWREKGRICLHSKWRVLNLLLLNRRLPPADAA